MVLQVAVAWDKPGEKKLSVNLDLEANGFGQGMLFLELRIEMDNSYLLDYPILLRASAVWKDDNTRPSQLTLGSMYEKNFPNLANTFHRK